MIPPILTFLALFYVWLPLAKGATQSKWPCYDEESARIPATCTSIEIPSGMCGNCNIGEFLPSSGKFTDCTRMTGLENNKFMTNHKCLASLIKYVALNPCDTARAKALSDYTDKTSSAQVKETARQILDNFVYAICEGGCDCITLYGAKRNIPSSSAARRNCGSHARIDTCKLLPDIRLIRAEGTEDTPELPRACNLLFQWQKTSAGTVIKANTFVEPDLKYFLDRMVNATELLTDLPFYQRCFDLEAAQEQIDLFPGPPPGSTLVIAVNAGSKKNYTDTQLGIEYTEDKFENGKASLTTNPIAQTNDDLLYQTERYKKGGFKYGVDVSSFSGTHNFFVLLHWAELYFNDKGQRAFHVGLHKKRVLRNFDIYAAAGAKDTAHVTWHEVNNVTGGMLYIRTKAKVDKPKISAFAVWAVPK